MSLKAIIVDDEIAGRSTLRILLGEYCTIVDIVAEAGNVREAAAAIKKYEPELVFLDIQMPGGNGFELFNHLTQINFETVFVTSYERYAINAIRFCALDYLLKPVDKNELNSAVQKAVKKLSDKKRTEEQYNILKENIFTKKIKKIIVPFRGNELVVGSDIITHANADSNYCYLIDNTGKSYHLARTLGDVEDFLRETGVFIRISRGILVNTVYISTHSRGEPMIIHMRNGDKFEVSRRRRAETREAIISGGNRP